MRGTKAKKIRKLAYKAKAVYRKKHVNSVQYNRIPIMGQIVADTLRGKYQGMKKLPIENI